MIKFFSVWRVYLYTMERIDQSLGLASRYNMFVDIYRITKSNDNTRRIIWKVKIVHVSSRWLHIYSLSNE